MSCGPLLVEHLGRGAKGIVAAAALAEIGPPAAEALPVLLASPLRQGSEDLENRTVAEDETWLDACAQALESITTP
ncbi:hypothetical protein [Dactylosporangium salmoneum]|uniref:Uncharacterized protein n=1 Tax=Dactylosporangium salmoneum TaxID=53361 RepID=A0ABP5TAI3_9ACTN